LAADTLMSISRMDKPSNLSAAAPEFIPASHAQQVIPNSSRVQVHRGREDSKRRRRASSGRRKRSSSSSSNRRRKRSLSTPPRRRRSSSSISIRRQKKAAAKRAARRRSSSSDDDRRKNRRDLKVKDSQKRRSKLADDKHKHSVRDVSSPLRNASFTRSREQKDVPIRKVFLQDVNSAASPSTEDIAGCKSSSPENTSRDESMSVDAQDNVSARKNLGPDRASRFKDSDDEPMEQSRPKVTLKPRARNALDPWMGG